jgi:hypothetical protein
VILGGLATSTLLNLFVVPTLYLKFGRPRERNPMSGQMAIAAEPGGAPPEMPAILQTNRESRVADHGY